MNINMKMKNQQKISTQQESNDQINCSCQILNDTQLSNVGDTDCSCSECLQANLDAFNDFKDTQERQKLKAAKSLGKLPSRTNKKTWREDEKTKNKFRDSSIYNRNTNQNLNKIRKNNQQTKSNIKNMQNGQQHFSSQNINDFILITKQRTRQYINQSKKLQQLDKLQKQKLKEKIKENLEILKYTVKSLQDKGNQGDQDQNKQNLQTKFKPRHKWNHQPVFFKQLPKDKKCKRKKQKKFIDTNLKKIIPQFQAKRNQLLQQAKQKRLQKFKQCKGCPYDACPNHHMRTSKTELMRIQKFIKKQVQKYNQNKLKQKINNQEKQKVRKAKLRAIDLKCKQKLLKSKKYDPSDSRTSFHLSIDHFSTFSDLRVNKIQKDQEKQHRKQVKKMMKQKGGRLEQAIYEDVFEEQQQGNKQSSKPLKQPSSSSLVYDQKKPYCQKITKQAKITSPKKLKQGDALHKKNKKQKSSLNLDEQKKKTKQIQMQIQRKKRQLMQQYKRQKQLNEVKNEKIKNQYKKELEKQQVRK